MNVLDMIAARVGEPNVQALGQKLGTNRQQTLMTVAHSFPVLLSGMTKNTRNPEGASAFAGALDRDHDGSVLTNISGLIANPDSAKGSGILRHVFGDEREQVAQQVGAKSGVSADTAGKAMEVVAPMVMAFIGKKKRSEGLDAGGIANFLLNLVTGGKGNAGASNSGGGGGLLGGLTDKLGGMGNVGGLVDKAKGFIDRDKDGDVMDDLQSMLGGLLGGK